MLAEFKVRKLSLREVRRSECRRFHQRRPLSLAGVAVCLLLLLVGPSTRYVYAQTPYEPDSNSEQAGARPPGRQVSPESNRIDIRREDATDKVALKGFTLNWNALETDIEGFDHNQYLMNYLSEHGGQLTVEEMHLLAAGLTRKVRALGYQFHSVYVPAQELIDGILRLEVVEGRVGLIDIRNNRSYSTKTLMQPLAFLKGKTIFQPEVEESIEVLNSYPGLSVFSYYSRGDKPGEANINVSVVDERAYSGAIEVDNHGTEATGQHRLSVNANWNNPIGKGGMLNVRLLKTDGENELTGKGNTFGSFSFKAPLYSPKRLLGLRVSRNQFALGGDVNLEPFKLSGIATNMSVVYTQKSLMRPHRKKHFTLSLNTTRNELNSDISDEAVASILENRESSHTIKAAWSNFYLSKQRRFSANWNVSYTLGRWRVDGEQDDPGFEHAYGERPNFRMPGLQAATQMRFGNSRDWYTGLLGLDVRSQYSSDALPSSQKMSLTGVNGVNALAPGFYSADRGGLVKISWQILALGKLKPSLYWEYGYGEKLNLVEAPRRESVFGSRARISGQGIALAWSSKSWGLTASWASVSSVDLDEGLIQPEDDSLALAKLRYSF